MPARTTRTEPKLALLYALPIGLRFRRENRIEVSLQSRALRSGLLSSEKKRTVKIKNSSAGQSFSMRPPRAPHAHPPPGRADKVPRDEGSWHSTAMQEERSGIPRPPRFAPTVQGERLCLDRSRAFGLRSQKWRDSRLPSGESDFHPPEDLGGLSGCRG